MSVKTEIAWCDSTCNPAMGCDGCELPKCYARLLVGRYAGQTGWPASFDKPELFLDRIKKALKWPDLTGKDRPDKPWLDGKSRHIFWCDLGEPFDPQLPEDWLAPYLPMLSDSPHVHIFCTKRPDRARLFFERHRSPRNLILLTTVTSDATQKRAWDLLSVPVFTRGLSLEPLIGPVDLDKYELLCKEWRRGFTIGTYLDWVIVGGESGPGARPCRVEWIRSVVEQCAAASVPIFIKQMGSYWARVENASIESWEQVDRKGSDPDQWLDDLRVRQMPEVRNA
mgnify:FL=1